MKKLNYYFEIWEKNRSLRVKITADEAYGVLHMYGLKDDEWKKEEICVLSSSERMYSLVRSYKKYDVMV